jgi:hypothetical protein
VGSIPAWGTKNQPEISGWFVFWVEEKTGRVKIQIMIITG